MRKVQLMLHSDVLFCGSLIALLSVSVIHRGSLVVSMNWQFWGPYCYLDVENQSLEYLSG